MLSGQHRLSIRQIRTLLAERYGLVFSIGAISAAQGTIAPAMVEP